MAFVTTLGINIIQQLGLIYNLGMIVTEFAFIKCAKANECLLECVEISL